MDSEEVRPKRRGRASNVSEKVRGLLAITKEQPSGAKQLAEKGLSSTEHCEGHTSGAKAPVDPADFIPGINPRPTAQSSFSAACKAQSVRAPRSARLKSCPFKAAASRTLEVILRLQFDRKVGGKRLAVGPHGSIDKCLFLPDGHLLLERVDEPTEASKGLVRGARKPRTMSTLVSPTAEATEAMNHRDLAHGRSECAASRWQARASCFCGHLLRKPRSRGRSVCRPRELLRTMPSKTTIAPSSPCLIAATSCAASMGSRVNATWSSVPEISLARSEKTAGGSNPA